MVIVETAAALEQLLGAKSGQKIGFVPTMGALHQGHLSLVEQARAVSDLVVVSVFVNPTQFNDKKDLERYPRDLQADARLVEGAGADVLFAPTVTEIYPTGVDQGVFGGAWERLATVMEGPLRPGHFQGVVQVVGRLFDLVQPKVAFFGEKDFQQLAIIQAMVVEQKRQVQIVGCPIVRAADGLALSSRNALLAAEHRAVAPEIYRIITALKRDVAERLDRSIENLLGDALANLKNIPYLCPDYLEVVDPVTLQKTQDRGVFRICAAVWCGDVRLIDNV